MECTLDPCKLAANVSTKVTCGEETQQIVAKVFARIYALASPGNRGNLTCADDADAWSAQFNGASESCDVSSAVLDQCKDDVDCVVNVADLATGCSLNGSLAIDLKIDCGNAGTDLLTVFVLLMLVMVALAMGTVTTIENFKDIFREQKKAFFVGFASQFGFMPLFSYVMSQAMGFSALESVGIIMCGCAPGGSTSNLFTYWAGGNVPLSIAMSAASTIASFVMLPLLFFIYVQNTVAKDLDAELPWSTMAIVLITIIVPVGIGMYIKNTRPVCAKYVEKMGGIMGALFLLISLVFGVVDNQKLFDMTIFWKSWLLGLLFQPVGCIFGYTVARLFKMEYKDASAIALETGVQNYAVSLAVVVLSLEGCDRAEALTFILTAMAFYLVHSPIFVLLLRNFVLTPKIVVWPETKDVMGPYQFWWDKDSLDLFWWNRPPASNEKKIAPGSSSSSGADKNLESFRQATTPQ